MSTFDTIKYKSVNPLKNYLIKKFKNSLLELVKRVDAKKVLDAGCGEGYMLSFLNGHMGHWEVAGFDIEESLVFKAKEKIPSAFLSVRSIYESNFPDSEFDLVLSTEVLEHLQQPKEALKEISRITKRWAILSVPNEPLFALSCLAAGKNIRRFGNHKGHCNRWSAKAFTGLVSNYFNIIAVLHPFPWTMVLCEKKALKKDAKP